MPVLRPLKTPNAILNAGWVFCAYCRRRGQGRLVDLKRLVRPARVSPNSRRRLSMCRGCGKEGYGEIRPHDPDRA